MFFLVTAEDLQGEGKIDATRGTVRQAVEKGETPPPRLMYTEEELREVRKLQTVARALRRNQGGTP